MFTNKSSGNGCLFSSDFTSKLLLHCSQQHPNDRLLLRIIPDTSSLPKRYDIEMRSVYAAQTTLKV